MKYLKFLLQFIICWIGVVIIAILTPIFALFKYRVEIEVKNYDR